MIKSKHTSLCILAALWAAVNAAYCGHEIAESKKQIIEPEQPWLTGKADVGYKSKYLFRGTNLTPESDGIAFAEVQLQAKRFTLGIWGAAQIGEAFAPSFAIGEGGAANFSGRPRFRRLGVEEELVPKTEQKRFNELDIYLAYDFDLGPVHLTIGNILFLIDREARTFLTENIITPGFVFTRNGQRSITNEFETVEDEQYDRLFIGLSSKIPLGSTASITPRLTYYQTVLNDGTDGSPFVDRNDELGGYLDFRVNGHVDLLGDLLDWDSVAILSYSFGDRSDAQGNPLRDFNHFEVGSELTFHVNQHFSVTALGGYAQHIAEPTAGTDYNEWFGGGRLTVEF